MIFTLLSKKEMFSFYDDIEYDLETGSPPAILHLHHTFDVLQALRHVSRDGEGDVNGFHTILLIQMQGSDVQCTRGTHTHDSNIKARLGYAQVVADGYWVLPKQTGCRWYAFAFERHLYLSL